LGIKQEEEKMEQVTLEAMMRRLSRVAERMFDERGEVEMCWAVDIPGKGQALIISPVVVGPDEKPGKAKQSLADFMREKFAELHVTRYAYACECWSAPTTEDSDKWVAEHGSLQHYPGRREMISVYAEDGHRNLFAIRDIIRPAIGKPYLTKLEINPANDMVENRWSGLLLPKVKSSSELPDDEGTVFITAVPDAPFQILGRRANNGELYVGSIGHPRKGSSPIQDILKDKDKLKELESVGAEILTGPEAEKLIAAVKKTLPVLQ
jgi:hypothetical protein